VLFQEMKRKRKKLWEDAVDEGNLKVSWLRKQEASDTSFVGFLAF